MPTNTDRTGYVFQPRDPSIYCEIYFPHKAAYQGAIYDALLEGKNPDIVKGYLEKSIKEGELIQELSPYPHLLDPDLYSDQREKIKGIHKARAVERIRQYRSSFAGWSMYTVAGVFFSAPKGTPPKARQTQYFEPAEELVQILRLIFRFSRRDLDQTSDEILTTALSKGWKDCDDVYRIIVFRTISRLERVSGLNPWDESERDRFLVEHAHWNTPSLKRKYDFAEQYFCRIAKEAEQWLDDCSLFVFGYLVRSFGQKLLQQEEAKQEEEIWVTHFLDLSVNVTARPQKKQKGAQLPLRE
jgi:hypothetical protein